MALHRWDRIGLLAAAAAWLAVLPLSAEELATPAAERLFAEKVRPLLADKCLACHGGKADDIKGSFDLRTRETALRGGESGEAAIVPGRPAESPLYRERGIRGIKRNKGSELFMF